MQTKFSGRRSLISLVAAALSILAAGCSGGNDVTANVTSTAPPGGGGALQEVNATITLGRVTGATVRLFQIAPDGTDILPGDLLEAREGGKYRLRKEQLPNRPFRICATAGTYTDEATDATLTNTLTTFCAAVPANARDVNVNVLTAMANERLKTLLRQLDHAANDAEINERVNRARNELRTFAGLQNPPDQTPPRLAAPDATADPTGDGYKLGVLHGAYSRLGARNQARCGAATDPLARLGGLIQDATDGVFDGNRTDPNNPANEQRITVPCNGAQENLPIGTGTAELLTALDEFKTTPLGTTMQVEQNGGETQEIRTAVATGEYAPPQVRSTPSQGLIAIDSRENVAYVPVYTLDTGGNARFAVVDLDPAVANPVRGTISLPGTDQPIASTFDSVNRRVYVEARKSADNSVTVYVIDPTNNAILHTLPMTGITHNGFFGGIIANPERNKVIVVGTDDLAIINIGVTPPVQVANSVVSLFGTDSIALNFQTEILFNASDGSNQIVDTSVIPPVVTQFAGGFGTTDGCGFDNLTNIFALDPEFQDQTTVFNFMELSLGAPANAPNITVLGFPGAAQSPLGEGPGGQLAVNVLTHQAIIADEFGVNFKLIQLPTAVITGAPNNKGQPGTSTTADSASAFTIAEGLLPRADLAPVDGTPETILTMRGDPNSLSVDPARNKMYGLVDTAQSFNSWPINDSRPLFLVEVDLSQPVLGASPVAVDANNNPLRWTPANRLIRLP